MAAPVGELTDYVGGFCDRGFRQSDRELFEVAWDRLEAVYLERLAEASAPHPAWRERFRAAATETVRLVGENPLHARFLVVDSLSAGELGRLRQRGLSHRLIPFVDQAREELEEPDRIPKATAPWIVAIFFDRIYRSLLSESADSLETQLPELMFLAVSAYFGTEAGLSELPIRP